LLGDWDSVLLIWFADTKECQYHEREIRALGLYRKRIGETELRAALAALCLVLLMIGIGLWRMMPWARTAMITISILTICSGAENLLEYRLDQHIEKSLDFTDVLLVCFFLYYFSRSKIKDRFLNVRSAMTAPNAN
jgi:hypothetical protein